MKNKKFYLQVLDPVGRWTGNAFLFEAGLTKPRLAGTAENRVIVETLIPSKIHHSETWPLRRRSWLALLEKG